MRFRSRREAGFAQIGLTARIAGGLLAIALVVAFNQLNKPAASVLGIKAKRCEVGGASVALGLRRLSAQTLTVTIRNGGPGAVLLPPKKVTPTSTQATVPLTLLLGVRGAGKGKLEVTVVAENGSTCPIAARAVRLATRAGAASTVERTVRLSDRDRVILDPGKQVRGHVVVPVTDGSWTVDASTTAEVGTAF